MANWHKSSEPDTRISDVSDADQKVQEPWIVLKFGGSSVSNPDNWQRIGDRVGDCLSNGQRPLVVHSALLDVSNKLEALVADNNEAATQETLAQLREQHFNLAESLGVDASGALDSQFSQLLNNLAERPSTGRASPAVHAKIVANGELLSTRIGHAYLNSRGIETEWLDARTALQSRPGVRRSELQNFVSATCDVRTDPALLDTLSMSEGAVLTQGFIASNKDGHTVLLGREGSDTSAAYFGVLLQAHAVEIWTDVPGMFSADPRIVPSARMLKEVTFEEAQELASTGSKVLHPRCISPLRQYGIPLYIRCTTMPENPGTRISSVVDDSEPCVKGLSTRSGVTLISMQSSAMWHEVGFLADAFDCFRSRGVSVDLVSTSETNVTVTIDVAEDLVPEDVLSALVGDLEKLCRVNVIRNCAVVSLVGRRIRAILPRLAPALSVFEDEKIHLVSQAANDLNLSFVIDETQAQRLLLKLHSSVIRDRGGADLFGESWESLMRGDEPMAQPEKPWWITRRDDLLKIADVDASAYVYNLATMRNSAQGLLSLACIDRVLYATKANTNPSIVRELAANGVDFDCVSPGEVDELLRLVPGMTTDRILFTPNFAPRSEYEWAIGKGLQITLDNLFPLQAWPELFDGVDLFIRIDPGKGRGHHDHVRTAGVHSKFGVPLFELDELERLVRRAKARIIGLHAHTGSGILDPDAWNIVAEQLADAATRFPQVKTLDLGGGLGVPEKTGDEAFDIETFAALLSEFRQRHPKFDLWIEPGRFLVAQCGVLISKVTQTKGKGDLMYVGIGTGMNSLIRPALYGAYHEIVNLSKTSEPSDRMVTIVGPICETGDKMGIDRLFPETGEGDVILIANAGAYGRVMASNYNMRDPAPEYVI